MVDKSVLRAPNIVGSTGLRRSQGEAIVDSEFLPQLRGTAGLDVLHAIAYNNSTVSASLHAIRAYMLRAPLIVEAKEDKPRYNKAANYVRECLTDKIVRDLVDDAIQMLIYGFHIAEIVTNKRDKFYLHKLAPRAARTILAWVWDEYTDEPVAVVQQPWVGHRVVIPLVKCLHFRTTRGEADNPQGLSALRGAYRDEFFARRLQELEGIGIERDLAGLPVLKVPGEMLDPNATPQQLAALKTFEELLANIKRDKSEGVVLPSDRDELGNAYFDIQLMSVAGNRQVDVGRAIDRLQKRIANVFLTEFLFLGVSGGGTGSYALSSDKTTMFKSSLRALLNHISDHLCDRLIPYLFMLNGMDTDLAPKLRFGDFDNPTLEAMSGYVSSLRSAGYLVPDTVTDQHLREIAGLPHPDGEPLEKPETEMPPVNESEPNKPQEQEAEDENSDDVGKIVDLSTVINRVLTE